jgi:hypothetical protein
MGLCITADKNLSGTRYADAKNSPVGVDPYEDQAVGIA